jgi:hypothetical protein
MILCHPAEAPGDFVSGRASKGEIGCGEATIDIEAKIDLIDRSGSKWGKWITT